VYGVVNGEGDAYFRAYFPWIEQAVSQDSHGQAGVIRIVRDERGEGFELNVYGKIGIEKAHPGQRVLAGELRAGKPAQAGSVIRSETILAFIRRQNPRFEHAGNWLLATGLNPDRRKSVGGRPALVRPVEYLPVAKLAAPAQRNAAGGHAAEWEGEHLQLSALEEARKGDAPGLGPMRCSRSQAGFGKGFGRGLGEGRPMRGLRRNADSTGSLLEEIPPTDPVFCGHRSHPGERKFAALTSIPERRAG